MRPRLLAGLKQLPVEIVVVPFADMETQVALVGKKIAPILQNHDGTSLTESLKITQYLDDIGVNMLSDEPLCSTLESQIQGMQKDYMSLTAPKFILSMREFQNQAEQLDLPSSRHLRASHRCDHHVRESLPAARQSDLLCQKATANDRRLLGRHIAECEDGSHHRSLWCHWYSLNQ